MCMYLLASCDLAFFFLDCPYPDLMKNPASIPDGRITSNVNSTDGSTAEDVRPGGNTFNPSVPQKAGDPKPSVKVVLSNSGPVNTNKIVVPPSTTNVGKVTVLVPADQYTPSGTGTTPASITLSPGASISYIPVVENATPDATTGQVPFPSTVKVSEVVVVVESPKKNPDGTLPKTYKIEVGVHACVNGKFVYPIWIKR